MRRWITLAAVIVLVFSISAIAFAQGDPPGGTVPLPPGQVGTATPDEEDDDDLTATATPVPDGSSTETPGEGTPTDEPSEEEAATATAEAEEEVSEIPDRAYLTIDLGGGFALDPFFVSVNGGGPVDASTLDDSCVGWISERPVVQLNWSGTAEFAEAFVYSDHNPSLVVQTPEGDYLCNDDTNDLLLDPTLEVVNPVSGTYNIWIGNIDNVGLIPAVLVLTSRSEINTGTFDLQNLVRRPAIREVLLNPADTIPGFAEIQQRLVDALAAVDTTDVVIDADSTITFTQPISGGVPGFVFPTAAGSPFSVCNGIVNPDDATLFTLGEGIDTLNVFAESEVDSTLIVVGPDGLAYCTDESPDETNRNPQLLLEGLAPGVYAIAVGNVAPDGSAEAVVTISTDATLAPVLRSPEEIGGGE